MTTRAPAVLTMSTVSTVSTVSTMSTGSTVSTVSTVSTLIPRCYLHLRWYFIMYERLAIISHSDVRSDIYFVICLFATMILFPGGIEDAVNDDNTKDEVFTC